MADEVLNVDFSDQLIFYLFKDELYFNKVFQLLKPDFFEEDQELVIKYMKQYISKFNSRPSAGDLLIFIKDNKKDDAIKVQKYLKYLKEEVTKYPIKNYDLLMDKTEEWIKFKYLEKAILDSVDIIKNREKDKVNIIEDKVKEALLISFDDNLGLDYKNDLEKRAKFYKEEAERYQIELETLNMALSPGFTKNALYLFVGKTGVGKTLYLVNIAELLVKAGYNVLYVTAEMSEMKISERIDAKILKVPIKELYEMDDKLYLKKLRTILDKSYPGNLQIKEYPTGQATMMDVKYLLKELKLKKNFTPDFIIFDYLNIFASYRLSSSKSAETYTYYKAVAEEMRALSSEKIGIITATQTNRAGAKKSPKDVDDTHISESYGIEFTVDWSGVIMSNEELKERGEILLKVIKTRFGDNVGKIYKLGIDYNTMMLYDLNEEERELIPEVVKEQEANDEIIDAKFQVDNL